MRRLLVIPVLVFSLLIAALVVAAVFEARDMLPFFGVLIIWVSGIALFLFVVLLFVIVVRVVNKPHVVNIGPHGAYIVVRGQTVPLKPLTQVYIEGSSVVSIEPPRHTTTDFTPDFVESETEEEQLQEGDTTEEDDEIKRAAEFIHNGVASRRRLASAMGIGERRASDLIAIVKSRGL